MFRSIIGNDDVESRYRRIACPAIWRLLNMDKERRRENYLQDFPLIQFQIPVRVQVQSLAMDFAFPINTKHANGNICMNSKVLAIVTTSIAFECFHPLCWLTYHSLHTQHHIRMRKTMSESFSHDTIFLNQNNKILVKRTPLPYESNCAPMTPKALHFLLSCQDEDLSLKCNPDIMRTKLKVAPLSCDNFC